MALNRVLNKAAWFRRIHVHPYALQGIFQSLPANTQSFVLRDYEVRKKSAFFAYFFWFFFGFHYLYLGRIGMQLIYWLTIGGFGFWMLIDLFRIPGMVERKNEDIARELMAQYQAMRVGLEPQSSPPAARFSFLFFLAQKYE